MCHPYFATSHVVGVQAGERPGGRCVVLSTRGRCRQARTDRTVGTGVCKDLKRGQKALSEMVKPGQYLTTESICEASCASQDGRVRREENKRGAEPTRFSGWKMVLRT